MAEYINKDDVLKIIKDIEMLYGKGSNDDEIISCISSIRGTDVIERKRGKWIQLGKCSECGGSAPFWPMASTYYESDFCQHCGADMR